MKFYQSEIDAGLCDIMKAGQTLAFRCAIEPIKNPVKDNITKASHALGQNVNLDLFYLRSVLASVGTNLNDDVFTAEELFKARSTPLHKKFNFEHDENDIFGCIIDSIAVDSNGAEVTSYETIQDIVTQAVLWTHWEDDHLQTRMNTLIEEIGRNEWFVSMESLFRDFDYLLVRAGTEKYISRSEESAFLTKYLRSFGGAGTYEDYEIKRVLKNFIFSGKGLVRDPANKRSIILNKSQAENKMSDITKEQFEDVKRQLAKANETVDSMKQEKETLVTAEIETLRGENATLQSRVDELKSLAETLKSDHKAELASVKEDLKALEDAKAALEQEKVDLLAAQATATREAALVAANVDPEKAKEICMTWATASDEQFGDLVSLYAKTDDKSDKDKKKKSDDSDDKDDDFDMGSASAGAKDTDLNLNNDTDVVDEISKALAKEISATLTNRKVEE